MSKAEDAWERAAMYGDRARAAHDEETRMFFRKLRNSWIRVAHNYQLAEYLDTESGTPAASP